jgi:hypothetical protein
MPYLPNTSLTYGGAAGMWYGLTGQLGEKMSMPEYGMNCMVYPLKPPLDTAHGVTEGASVIAGKAGDIASKGYVITKACKNPAKLLAIFDYLFTEEGGKLFYGITKEQGADTDPAMIAAGLQDGAYWYDASGNIVWNPLLTVAGGPLDYSWFNDGRLPGLRPQEEIIKEQDKLDPYAKLGNETLLT